MCSLDKPCQQCARTRILDKQITFRIKQLCYEWNNSGTLKTGSGWNFACRWGHEISTKLITEVKNAHAKYKADLAQKEKLEEEENKCKKQAIANAAPRQEANYKLNEIEVEILKFESSLKAANEIFEDGNNKLQEELSTKNKHLGCNKIQCVQSKI